MLLLKTLKRKKKKDLQISHQFCTKSKHRSKILINFCIFRVSMVYNIKVAQSWMFSPHRDSNPWPYVKK